MKRTFLATALIMVSCLLSYAQGIGRIIHVETAGTLPDLIADSEKYTITDLKLSGPLNGTDIRFLRTMENLRWLDLEETRIVAGGEPYAQSDTGTLYYTEDNTMGPLFFPDSRGWVERLVLPAGIRQIEGDETLFAFFFQRVVSKAAVPPACSDKVFETILNPDATLYVPEGSREAYAQADGWRHFSRIIETHNSPVTVHVETPGTLSGLIATEEQNSITDLTVTGPLNGDDIRLIREMTGMPYRLTGISLGQVVRLDLRGASIVEGGGAYFMEDDVDGVVYDPENWAMLFYTENNVIGPDMFGKNHQLQEIHLPASIEKITEWAFFNCAHLKDYYVYTAVPPEAVGLDGTFYRLAVEPVLHVPTGAKAVYAQTDGWKLFPYIVEEELSGVSRPAQAVPRQTVQGAARYTLDGRSATGRQPGIWLERQADGSVRKTVRR